MIKRKRQEDKVIGTMSGVGQLGRLAFSINQGGLNFWGIWMRDIARS